MSIAIMYISNTIIMYHLEAFRCKKKKKEKKVKNMT